jgi:hypothetical protein
MVDNATALDDFLTILEKAELGIADLFFHGEGQRLRPSWYVVYSPGHFRKSSWHAYILDVITLGSELFTKKSKTRGISLKSILKHPRIPKIRFDVRQYSAIMFGTAGFVMRGCYDLQLMNLAITSTGTNYLWGLPRSIQDHFRLSALT